MAQLYHIKKRKDHRRFTPLSVFITVVVLAVVGLLLFVWLSSRGGATVIDTTKNKPISGTILPADASYNTVEDGRFTLKLPEEWIEEERVKNERYDYVTYVADDKNTTGRELTVYVGSQHKLDPLTKIVPVKVVDEKIVPENISPQCSTFTDFADENAIETQALWDGIKFPCSPNKITNYIGAGTVESGYGFIQKGSLFYLRFTDHSARPDNSIFLNILRSFEAS